MSSNIKVIRICRYCNKEFIAKTTVTKYCSKSCNSRDYKAQKRAEKLGDYINYNSEWKKNNDFKTLNQLKNVRNEIRLKEFLTVKDAAILLNSSIRTIYRLIENETIKAKNISIRKTLIRRDEIDNLFNK